MWRDLRASDLGNGQGNRGEMQGAKRERGRVNGAKSQPRELRGPEQRHPPRAKLASYLCPQIETLGSRTPLRGVSLVRPQVVKSRAAWETRISNFAALGTG